MQIMDAVKAHAEIARLAKTNAQPEMRRIKKMDIGQVVRQGDIYIHAVSSYHSCGRKLKSRQLAVGQTRGARHVAEPPSTCYAGTTLPDYCDARTFLGPFIKSNKRFSITHPEHAHVSLPAGTYQVTHQMDARTLQRVQD